MDLTAAETSQMYQIRILSDNQLNVSYVSLLSSARWGLYLADKPIQTTRNSLEMRLIRNFNSQNTAQSIKLFDQQPHQQSGAVVVTTAVRQYSQQIIKRGKQQKYSTTYISSRYDIEEWCQRKVEQKIEKLDKEKRQRLDNLHEDLNKCKEDIIKSSEHKLGALNHRVQQTKLFIFQQALEAANIKMNKLHKEVQDVSVDDRLHQMQSTVDTNIKTNSKTSG
ncbi:unnamed protein product [Didymodactylos carnosus]|uniref:Uncharacterized protein n=1 Tax=Didymodactylos carnosus TaxID=1234261 RepID=A0A815RSQ3_9BILA|nr:unnamed protein product [Didymodactylos carnosus]CAF4345519.1 unnamed protein product [Didymodactylos carnosus]